MIGETNKFMITLKDMKAYGFMQEAMTKFRQLFAAIQATEITDETRVAWFKRATAPSPGAIRRGVFAELDPELMEFVLKMDSYLRGKKAEALDSPVNSKLAIAVAMLSDCIPLLMQERLGEGYHVDPKGIVWNVPMHEKTHMMVIGPNGEQIEVRDEAHLKQVLSDLGAATYQKMVYPPEGDGMDGFDLADEQVAGKYISPKPKGIM